MVALFKEVSSETTSKAARKIKRPLYSTSEMRNPAAISTMPPISKALSTADTPVTLMAIDDVRDE